MRSIFDVEPEAEPDVLTPEQMRAQLKGAAERNPEDVYGAGLPKGHVKAVLSGEVEPLPELLSILELRPAEGGYASTIEPEPEEPESPSWPDGRQFTRADEDAVVDCVREAFGAALAAGDSELDRYDVLASVLMNSMAAAGAMEDTCEFGEEHTALAFLAGAIWERRRVERPGTA